MRRVWLWWIAGATLTALVAGAWIDGGREPLRDVTETVPVPKVAQ